MPVDFDFLRSIVRCPVCHEGLDPGPPLRCTNGKCRYCKGFLNSNGQPVLINFDKSIFTQDVYLAGGGTVLPRDATGTFIGRSLRRITYGSGSKSSAIVGRFTEQLVSDSPQPRLLIIGGGTIGEGMAELYRAPPAVIVGIDAYASEHTALVCDAHELPFNDETFDGVVIQAVLEHVLDPTRVVDEINRVLKPGGLVYADTPFMQQVHEGAYDFTRFTKSGHRWLFRRFVEIDSGVVGGPGIALLWSISYFARALGAGPKLTALITALFFWVRPLERLMDSHRSADAASATYFVGKKSSRALAANEMPALYNRSPPAGVQSNAAE